MKIRRHSLPNISSASLSDIAFLLLVFFIATTIFPTEKGLALLLPAGGGKIIPRTQVVVLSVENDGSVLWDDVSISVETLSDRVEERLLAKPKSVFLIESKPEAPYRAFVDVLDEVKLGGADRISIRKQQE